ncbi:MAG: xanthine dehydrogenase family protein subunit M [Candidatus Euphemobacter frigidus]|nr:xanthine dehydrogenase family protein subunit M [Candidatus Euphemobacter frigidus]MDP8275785.1 xanthine dehydrogenase family protein subunit M [Candidatus Euphemobacter frigidus]
MKFNYRRAGSLKEALEILSEGDESLKILAGGTDLLVMIQDKLISPGVLLDINGLEELKGIEESNGRIRLGALVSHGQIAADKLLREKALPLVESCGEVGSPQIRNRGTIGGNLVMASPSGDSIPALYVLGAEVSLKSRDGERVIPIEDFFTGVKKCVIRPDELLISITFPALGPDDRGFFKKLGQRKALAISKVSTAAVLTLRAGVVVSIRIALGAVGTTVLRAPRTEAFLTGKSLAPEVITEAARLCAEESRAITDIRSTGAYRDEMAGLLLARGLEKLA